MGFREFGWRHWPIHSEGLSLSLPSVKTGFQIQVNILMFMGSVVLVTHSEHKLVVYDHLARQLQLPFRLRLQVRRRWPSALVKFWAALKVLSAFCFGISSMNDSPLFYIQLCSPYNRCRRDCPQRPLLLMLHSLSIWLLQIWVCVRLRWLSDWRHNNVLVNYLHLFDQIVWHVQHPQILHFFQSGDFLNGIVRNPQLFQGFTHIV